MKKIVLALTLATMMTTTVSAESIKTAGTHRNHISEYCQEARDHMTNRIRDEKKLSTSNIHKRPYEIELSNGQSTKNIWTSISWCEAESIVMTHGEYDIVGTRRVIRNGSEIWAVYTYNPVICQNLPYLVHYVDTNGQYMYYEETTLPYDVVPSKCPKFAFQFMQNLTWSGTVILHDGALENVTVPVMKDIRTGMYYLGDVKRKIAVADAWSYLYGDDITIVSSQNNNGWKGADLIAYSNYIKAYDFFHEKGFVSEPTLLLKDYCNKDRKPIEYEGYMGHIGWNCFSLGYMSNQNEYLDRVTHHYAQYVLTESLNDFAIGKFLYNDICNALGYVCYAGDYCDLIGRMSENGTIKFGCAAHANPYIDIETPLARIAVRLMNHGMTVEESEKFWTTVMSNMNRHRDIREVLRRALKMSGLEDYHDLLEPLISTELE